MNEARESYRGYRSPALGSMSPETDLLKVCAFEMKELRNPDIPDTLCRLGLIHRPAEAWGYLNRLHFEGYRRCVWLCDSVKQLRDCYFEGAAPEDLTLWQFRPGQWKVISVMPDGKLIAYRGEAITEEL